MPDRDRRSSATLKALDSGDQTQPMTTVTLPCMVGEYQSISALNNVGKLVPGVFRANPVVLEKFLGTCTSGGGTIMNAIYGNKGRLQGMAACHPAYFDSPLGTCRNLTEWSPNNAGLSLQRAYSEMNSPDLDIGMIVGELRETIEGLRHPLQALRKYISEYNKMSRDKRNAASQLLNMLSGSWLEWRYGIMPLLYTIQDIMQHVESLQERLNGKLFRKRGRVKYTGKAIARDTIARSVVGNFTIQGKVTVEVVKAKYVSAVYYSLNSPLTFVERYGCTAMDVPRILWELTRLSFVWDWFFGIGDWIESLSFNPKRVVKGSVTSFKTEITYRCMAQVQYRAMPYPCDSVYTAEYSKLDRRVNQSLPMLPAWDPASLSIKRQVDAISLIWQQLPKPRR